MIERRHFLKSVGGIAVAFSWNVPTVVAQQAARSALPGSLGSNRMLNGWIRIDPAGNRVSPKSDSRAGRSTIPGSARNRAQAPSTRSA